MTNNDPKRIIVALDYDRPEAALALAGRLDPARCRVKVGKELFTRAGPALVERLIGRGFDVFLDLKFHDIPNTVARACTAAAELGVWMLNVHAQGGRRMMEAAREAVETASGPRPFLIAVTVLTSLSDEELKEIGYGETASAIATRLATLAAGCGLDGVVSSAQEAAALRQARGDDFLLVTPGIRPAESEKGDQRRVMTPADAIRNSADYLVIGRPITASPDPLGALRAIQVEVDASLSD